jgi:glutamate N-acetyltransferase / amino-acid N-acetyltransferase
VTPLPGPEAAASPLPASPGVGVCHPRGFAAGHAACGMKRSGKADLALVASDRLATAAGVFTTNRVVAAPVTVSRAQVQGGIARAIVTNSGSANACTGADGRRDAWTMVNTASEALGIPSTEVLVASTGVIGRPLPIDDVVAGIHAAGEEMSAESGREAADAIRTTDAFAKLGETSVRIDGADVRIGGMAKGAGMIRPDMATTLAQITTDAAVPAPRLRRLLQESMAASFNAISVDGCTSTNDCVFILANGASGVTADGGRAGRLLTSAVAELALDLAKQVVRDGEGATRVCTYTVSGAISDGEARQAARAVAENVLVKCALHGADPNWGRILAALGAAGVHLDPDRVGVAFGGVPIVVGGAGVEGSEAAAAEQLSAGEVAVDIDLGLGIGRATVIASDLSPGYVTFNAGVTS